ncbi:MAG: deaminase [Bacillota bacterium]
MYEDQYYFNRAVELARNALDRGDDGFASVLVGPDGDILLERANEAGATRHNSLSHDTILLINDAVTQYDADFLGQCTVYAVMEPCVMCMGAAFWAGIRHIKFAMSEEELGELLPGSLSISSKEFARRSPRPMDSIGPYPGIAGAYAVVKDWVRSLGVPVKE